MKKALITMICSALAISFAACRKESKIEMNFSDKYEGKTVEVMNFSDSTILMSSVIADGKATFLSTESDSISFPLFTQVLIDGRIRAYYIMEEGKAVLCDSMNVPSGTPLNDKFSSMLSTLDSIESLDDMNLYLEYAESAYNENKENPIGAYFGVEWLKYADPQRVDSFLNLTSDGFRNMKRVKYYEEFARHRAQTSPGMKYTDFEGETEKGGKVKLSTYMKPGNYILVDFWASWCPYCIKELPDMKQLYADYHDKGFDIIGVAVRDKIDDTSAMVAKHELPWQVVYNTQRVPYDIYGFSGIPHHMLIGPDGVIISRGESVAQIRARIEQLLEKNKE